MTLKFNQTFQHAAVDFIAMIIRMSIKKKKKAKYGTIGGIIACEGWELGLQASIRLPGSSDP